MRHTIACEHGGLSFGGRAAVTAHRWDDKRLRTVFVNMRNNGARYRRNIRDSSAADCNSDRSTARDAQARAGQLIPDRSLNVGDARTRKVLADPVELHTGLLNASLKHVNGG